MLELLTTCCIYSFRKGYISEGGGGGGWGRKKKRVDVTGSILTDVLTQCLKQLLVTLSYTYYGFLLPKLIN